MEGGRGHKSHPLEFPLYSGFSRYVKVCRYIYIYTYRCRSSQVYELFPLHPLQVSVYHCQGNVAKFRCNNGSLFSRGRQPRFLLGRGGDPAKSTSPRKRRRRRGNETKRGERERERLTTKEEGFRYGLPRCLHWHAINGTHTKPVTGPRFQGEELDPRAHFSSKFGGKKSLFQSEFPLIIAYFSSFFPHSLRFFVIRVNQKIYPISIKIKAWTNKILNIECNKTPSTKSSK